MADGFSARIRANEHADNIFFYAAGKTSQYSF
jgi:hypothetical protein